MLLQGEKALDKENVSEVIQLLEDAVQVKVVTVDWVFLELWLDMSLTNYSLSESCFTSSRSDCKPWEQLQGTDQQQSPCDDNRSHLRLCSRSSSPQFSPRHSPNPTRTTDPGADLFIFVGQAWAWFIATFTELWIHTEWSQSTSQTSTSRKVWKCCYSDCGLFISHS